MGRWLADQHELPGIVLSSTAVRARTTAELVVDALGTQAAVHTSESLYLPDPQDILDAVVMQGEPHTRVLVVCHNPGVSEAITAFTGRYESMPTAAIAVIDFDIGTWSDLLVSAEGSLRSMWRVKSLPEG